MNRASMVLVLLFGVVVWIPSAPAQEEQSEVPQQDGGETAAQEPSAGRGIEAHIDRPASYYAVGEKPPSVTKVYRKRLRKVWSAVVKSLEETGIGMEVSDQAAGRIRTELTEFGPPKQRWGNVALPPPDISLERPILQRRGLNSGKFSLEILVKETDGGTSVSIEPYIEEFAPHLTQQRKIPVERFSNGKLEQILFEKIDEILD